VSSEVAQSRAAALASAGRQPSFERRFRAMGTEAHLFVVGPRARALAALGERRIRQLEARWSRFRSDSEISRLNAAAGNWILVSPDTVRLVDRSIEAWHLTGGAFDPSLLDALAAAGYDRPFNDIVQPVTVSTRDALGPAGAALIGIEVDAHHGAIRFPAGLAFDPGGIGKGLAADLVVRELRARGAEGAMVNLGGDVVVSGTPPAAHADGNAWAIAIDDPFEPGRDLARIAIEDGAVATSSSLRRRWSVRREHADDGPAEAHHLLDPHTCRPTGTGIAAATVCARAGWWAEALTKQLFVEGPDAIEAALQRAPSIVVTADRNVRVSPGLEGALL
jgi:thiamine biosynthesis lipoprotein